MNKVKRDAMQETINENIKRGIVESSNSAWNAPAFLVKTQNGPEQTMVSKRWQVVEDYRQLNTTRRYEVFTPPSVQELIDIVGSANKYYCSINLRQGYYHILLKASVYKKTTFSTGELAASNNIVCFRIDLSMALKGFKDPWERSLVDILTKVALNMSMTF
jgi:hypothetical protein